MSVEVRQIRLRKNDITLMPSILLNELVKEPNTQIFISNDLYYELVRQSKRFEIWEEDVYGSAKYCDTVEKAFLFKSNLTSCNFIMQLNFVEFSNDFTQLTYFNTKGISYTYYKNNMEKILIIHSD